VPRRLRQTIAFVTTTAATLACLFYLQHREADADARHGLSIVKEYRGRSGKTLPDLITAAHGAAPIAWTSATESGCFSRVRVDARAGQADDYAFTVDLGARSIHPANARGEEAIRTLEEIAP
jgi:hypothetical protein